MPPTHLRALKAYSAVDVQTSGARYDQYELALLMFDKTLEALASAHAAILAHDTNTKIQSIGKAVKILQDGLRTSLDLENGGELAANLDSLYDYCVLKLTLANANHQAELVTEVMQLLRPVADAWRQIRQGETQPSTESTGNQAGTETAPPNGNPALFSGLAQLASRHAGGMGHIGANRYAAAT